MNNADISFRELVCIMARLRDRDDGCPWDVEQTFHSIAPHTLEEAYEVADAIEREDWDDLCEELGDLLLQVVFHAQMAQEANLFSIEDVVRAINTKMITRHPHLFGSRDDIKTAADQTAAWEELKAKERAHKHATKDTKADAEQSALDDIPLPLPALLRAYKLQKRAARVGFDWNTTAPVFDKIREEITELEQVVQGDEPSADRLHDELGDVLFSCVNLARHLGVDPENALRLGNVKFERRFRRVEGLARDANIPLKGADMETLDALWDTAKEDLEG